MCPRCSGWLRSEPARWTCLHCGWETDKKRVSKRNLNLQARIDHQLRPRSVETRFIRPPYSKELSAHGEYLFSQLRRDPEKVAQFREGLTKLTEELCESSSLFSES